MTSTKESPPSLSEAAALAGSLAAAWQTGLLHALAHNPATASQAAAALNLDTRATRAVLEVLRSQGLLEREHDRYAATQAVLRELDGPSGNRDLAWRIWAHTPQFLQNGQTLFEDSPTSRSQLYPAVVGALGRMVEPAAKILAAHLDGILDEPGSLAILDVGAGNGVWSLAMLAQHHDARLCAVDFSRVLDELVAHAKGLGLDHRIETCAGNFHELQLPPDRFDRAIVAGVLRLESPVAAQALVARVAATLRPGGALIIVDALSDGSIAGDRALAAYALHLAVRTRSGQPHRESDLIAWLSQSGCDVVDRLDFEHMPAGAALVAVRR